MPKITHIVATGKVDADGDIINLKHNGNVEYKKPIVLLDHNVTKKVGEVIDIDVKDGNMEVTMVLNSHYYSGLIPSIGFLPVEFEKNEHGGRTFNKIKLVSVGLSSSPNADSSIKPLP